jgi:o-succinylbenzoate synthase
MVVMKVASFEFKEYFVALTSNFVAACHSHRRRKGILVKVQSINGDVGLGEIAPLPRYSSDSIEAASQSGRALAARLAGVNIPKNPDELSSIVSGLCESGDCQPSAVFGIETALADLAAKQRGLPLCKWLDPNATSTVPVNAVIGGETSDMEDQVRKLAKDGFTSFKLKVGVESAETDIARIRTVCRYLPEDGAIRLDANGSWDFESASYVLSRVNDCPIEYVEEPLLLSELHKLTELYAQTGTPFAIDESVLESDLWSTLIKLLCVRAVIIKPTMVGGLSVARHLFDMAQQLGKIPVVTSTLESGVGVSACLHLAASLGDKLLPCGLDTLKYFSETMINESLHPINGAIRIPDSAGLGVSLKG